MRRRVARRLALAALLLLAVQLAACEVPHTIRDITYGASETEARSAGLGAEGPLRVEIKFAAGGVKLHGADAGRLYDAAVTYCAEHTEPAAALAGASQGLRGLLTLDLHGRVGVFQGFGGERNRMDLRLTRDMPLDLYLSLGAGESVVDLRGLSVSKLQVKAGSGDSRIVFGDPNPVPAEHVEIEGPIGDLSVDRLGNSNASNVRIRGGVGFLEVDLRGAWSRDANILVEAQVGNMELTLPEAGPGIELRVGNPWRDKLQISGFASRGDALYSEGYDASRTKVHVTVEAGLGRLQVERNGRPL